MDSYTDYLYSCSLKDLKRETKEYKDVSKLDQGKKFGTLILKLIAKKLSKEIGMQTIKVDHQKIESDLIRDLNGRYLFIN